MKISMCTLPSRSVGFCACGTIKIWLHTSGNFHSALMKSRGASARSNLASVVVIDLNLWTKITILSVPRRGKDWNYIALMWDYFEQPQSAGRGQATGSRDSFCTRRRRTPLVPARLKSISFLLHFVTLTGRRAEECCVLHHQVSVSTLPSAASCVWVRSGCYIEPEEPSLSVISSFVFSEATWGQFFMS